MSDKNVFNRLFYKLIEKLFSIEENQSRDIGTPSKVLVVRQHNQFGDLLASVSLFRAIKETYPDSELSVIVSKDNFYAVTKNKFIDKYFIYNKKNIYIPHNLILFWRFVRREYDVVITPATVSISFTSCLIARISNSKIRIGPASLNGRMNKSAYLFDRRVDLDWKQYPDAHISDFGLDIVRPFGVKTKIYKSEVTSDEKDLAVAREFIADLNMNDGEKLIGLHVGAGKPQNRWSLLKFAKLTNELNNSYNAKFYFTGSNSDMEEINFIKERLNLGEGYFLNKQIPELAALISLSDLFITNDTGVMHVAGTTETPQISLFGPTNPFNWAPIGSNKFFIRKSDLIDDVTVGDVFNLCKIFLGEQEKVEAVDEK